MKIALINNLYPPEGGGGAEQVVQRMADSLLTKGHEVIVIAGSKKYKYEHFHNYKIIRYKPVNIYFYNEGQNYPFAIRLIWQAIDMFNIISYFQLKRILKRERPQRIICHNLKGLGYFTPALIKALNIEYYQYLHDVQLVYPSGQLLTGEEAAWLNRGFGQKFYQAMCRSLFKSPREVISPTHWLMDFYRQRGFFKNSKLTIKEIDWKKFDLTAIKNKLSDWQEKLRLKQPINFLYIGKLEKHKGIIWLADIWAEMPQGFTLTIIGDGNKKNKLLDIIKNKKNIYYSGKYKKGNVLKEAFNTADILIMPTLCYENRPEVILEAYKHNLPVIASELGGIPEILKPGQTGCLFKAGDKEDLKKVLAS